MANFDDEPSSMHELLYGTPTEREHAREAREQEQVRNKASLMENLEPVHKDAIMNNVACSLSIPEGWEISCVDIVKKGDFLWYEGGVKEASDQDVWDFASVPVLILKKKRWTPSVGELCFYVTSILEVEKIAYFLTQSTCQDLLKVGNLFRTQEEAEKYAVCLRDASEQFFRK